MESVEKQKVSYWETRKINIGNYESIECGLTVSHSIIEPISGYGNKTLEIREDAAVTVSGTDISNTSKAVNFVMQMVKKKLDAREKEVRLQTANWEGLDFDTEKKLIVRGLLDGKDYTGKFRERMSVGNSELDDEDLE